MEAEAVKGEPRFWFRPECGRDDRIGPDIGPFEDFLQLTYRELVCNGHGSTDTCVAVWNEEKGDWYLNGENPTVKRCTEARDRKDPWSDLVIYVKVE